MKELGVDTLNHSKVIIARGRQDRPMDKVKKDIYKEENEEYDKDCPFCRGNEENISQETGANK